MTIPKGYYRHRYGGLYSVVDVATSSVNGIDQIVIYRHEYPFERKLWARPLEEWTDDRFTSLTPTQFMFYTYEDREELKVEIAANKAKNNGQKDTTKV